MKKPFKYLGMSKGFTLIELMVVIAIVGIITLVASASYTKMIADTRMTTALQKFITDIDFARSEAMKRGETVYICSTSNGSSCSNGITTASSTWSSGWLIYASGGSPFTSSPASTSLLRISPPLSHGDTLTGGAAIQLLGNGFNTQSGASVTVVNGDLRRCTVFTAGSTSKIKVGSSNCP